MLRDDVGLAMPAASDLPFLLRLLDDNDPEVRPAVREQFESCQGDISHDLAALGISVSGSGRKRLQHWLEPGRRQTLMEEWIVPSGGSAALSDDWDSFENLLRLLSDFLHDGVTLRPSLPDHLDMLAEEMRKDLPEPTAELMRRWLFVKSRFQRPTAKADDICYFDLSYVIEHCAGNATSLGCLFMLLGRRLSVEVDGCNYPGHFLCKIHSGDRLCLIDCFHHGRIFDVNELLAGNLEISPKARRAIVSPCYLGDVLLRYLIEMQYSLAAMGRTEDANLLKKLAATLKA